MSHHFTGLPTAHESDPNPKLAPIYPNQFYAPLCLSSKLLANSLNPPIPSAWLQIRVFFCPVNYSSFLKIQFTAPSSERLPWLAAVSSHCLSHRYKPLAHITYSLHHVVPSEWPSIQTERFSCRKKDCVLALNAVSHSQVHLMNPKAYFI